MRGGGRLFEGGGALVCYFGREGGRLFGEGGLLERGRLFEEIRYLPYDLYLCCPKVSSGLKSVC